MLTEINTHNIIGHIAGLTTINKNDFINRWNDTILSNKINIIDLDNLTDKIINDKNMGLLYYKYEELSENLKNNNVYLKDVKTTQYLLNNLDKVHHPSYSL